MGAALMAATTATGGATSPGLSANLGFIPNKKQFKWNGSLASLKEFWISELEDGNANSLVNINSNANSEVLKFESALLIFISAPKPCKYKVLRRIITTSCLHNINRHYPSPLSIET